MDGEEPGEEVKFCCQLGREAEEKDAGVGLRD